jgi:hypothetical protein
MSDPNDSTITVDDGRALFSSKFLEFCDKVRNNDPSILPEPGKPFKIGNLSEKEDMKLADALLENIDITYLELRTAEYTKVSAKAMAKYVRTSKHLQRIDCNGKMRQREEILCFFLHAIKESTSLKDLHIHFPRGGGLSNLALEKMLMHTQSLRSLRLSFPDVLLQDIAVVAASTGLKKNTSLRELTLDVLRGATTISPIFTSLKNHPHLRRLCLRGHMVDLTGLETLLRSDNSKITDLEIYRFCHGSLTLGLTRVLGALRRHPTLTKLRLHRYRLGLVDARLIGMALCTTSSLQSLALTGSTLGIDGLAELAPALYSNTSIKVLDISGNQLGGMDFAEILRDIFGRNDTITTLDLSANTVGQTTGAVECIADGLGRNSTLLKINFSDCYLGDDGVSTLAQTLGSRNTTLQKLTLASNSITSTGLGVLLEAMEHSSHHITDLDLKCNRIRHEGANILARALENNALPNLTHLSILNCCIDDDGFIALVSALEQNTSLLHLDLRHDSPNIFGKRAFLALAESLPNIKVLQCVDLRWCIGLALAMPLLLAGLRKNTSLFRFYVASCAPSSVLPPPGETDRHAGGWKQEMERLGYRNRFLPLIRARKERLPPRGFWPHAFARVATLHDVIFEVLRSKPNLVLSENTDSKKAAKDTGVPKKRKRSDD